MKYESEHVMRIRKIWLEENDTKVLHFKTQLTISFTQEKYAKKD